MPILDEMTRCVVDKSAEYASTLCSAYLTEDHLVLAALEINLVRSALDSLKVDCNALSRKLMEHLTSSVPRLETEGERITETSGYSKVLDCSTEMAEQEGAQYVTIGHLMEAIDQTGNAQITKVLPEFQTTFGLLVSQVFEEMAMDNDMTDEFEASMGATGAQAVESNCLTDLMQAPARPYIGREWEIERLIEILCRKNKHNPIVTGDSGVGKTSLVTCGLANRLREGRVPDRLKGAKLYSLSIGDLMTGTTYRGQLESKVLGLLRSLSQQGTVLLFVDNFEQVMESGRNPSESALISHLRPYMEDSDIRFIGACSTEDYRKAVESDRLTVRRTQRVTLPPLTQEEAISVCEGLVPGLEEFHNVIYDKEAVQAAVELSEKYQRERSLPDKAIDLLDECGAASSSFGEQTQIDRTAVENTLSKICHIPVSKVRENEKERLQSLESRLKSRVFGQDEAAEQITLAIQMSRAGLNEENKPIASYLFVGPTGVGKTEEVKALSEAMDMHLISLDMSEYSEPHSVNKLFGSPAGYVGYDDGGLLVNEVREHPHSIVLLDEIEKAHSTVFNTLLQVLDEARLTDSKGKTADFRNCILIMTSNAGAKEASTMQIGFGQQLRTGAVEDAIKNTFPPEFIGRLSAVVRFNPITPELARRITRRELDKVAERMFRANNVSITFDESVEEIIASRGFSPASGARNIIHTIRQTVSTDLMKEVLFGSLQGGSKATISWDDPLNKISVSSSRLH